MTSPYLAAVATSAIGRWRFTTSLLIALPSGAGGVTESWDEAK